MTAVINNTITIAAIFVWEQLKSRHLSYTNSTLSYQTLNSTPKYYQAQDTDIVVSAEPRSMVRKFLNPKANTQRKK